MKRFLSTLTLLLCFAFTAVNAQDNYNATTMGEKVYLETANWGQNSPFNKQIFTSYGGSTNAKAGCVPTAYAIVMRYHGFPTEGTAKTLYNCQASTYVEITDRVYDFSKMPLTNGSNWTEEQQAETSKFFSHVLHACFPSSIGTGATTVNEGQTSKVLNDYFNYQLINASYQANFTMEQWIEKIKESIDNGCPIPYASDNSGTGDTRHMFVLDGYTANNYFHFNFGWNGSSNGWFKLDAITPSQGDNYSWIDGAEHYALFNLAPNKTMRTVTASVSPAGAGTVTVNGSANSADVMEGTTATLNATANSGYTFSHWSKGGAELGTEMTYKAKVAAESNDYVANFYTIGSSVNIPVNYDSNMGSVTYNGNIVSATGFNPNEYSEVTLTAEANDGYMFTGWEIVEGTETTKSSEKSITFIAKSGITVNANFALAGGEYKINKDNITPSGGNNSYCPTWIYNKTGDIEEILTLSTANGSTPVNALSKSSNKLYAHASDDSSNSFREITYTLTAKEGFVITGYSLTYVVGSSYKGEVTVRNATQSLTPNDTEEHTLTYQYANAARSSAYGTRTAEFVLSSTTAHNSQYITIKDLTVTVLSEGAEGGSTPTPDPTPTTCTVTTAANPAAGGTAKFAVGTGSQKTQGDVENGTQITLYAVANTGYNFVNWTLNGTVVGTTETCNVAVSQTANYVANFEAVQQGGSSSINLAGKYFRLKDKGTGKYMNIYDNSTHGEESRGGVNVTTKNESNDGQIFQFIESGTNYKLLSKTGYYITWAEWNVNADSKENGADLTFEPTATGLEYFISCTKGYFKIDDDKGTPSLGKFVYSDGAQGAAATWVLEEVVYYTVTARAGEGGNVSPLTSTVKHGASVTLTATPSTGYSFAGWYNGETKVSDEVNYTVTNVTANAEYVANFEIITYTISATANPGTAGSVTINDEAVSSKNVNENSTVTLVATPQAGYCFVNWTTLNGNVVSTDASYKFNATAAGEYVANFEQIVVNVTLTDAQSNTYNVQLSGFTNGVKTATVATKLTEKYPYITLGDNATLNGSNAAYTYSNKVTLPFKVSSVSDATKTYWHNIYYPSNGDARNPNYIAALNEDAVVDMAASPEHAYGENPTYNTKAGNPMISWAVYSANNSLEFVFKNELTNNYIKVESVSSSTTNNVKFVENAGDATAFSLLKDATDNYKGDYVLVANTGYLCATSSDEDYVTHFDSNNHESAWVKFVEVDYGQYIGVLDAKLGKFNVGDDKHMITDEIQPMIDALVDDYGVNITKSQFEAYFDAIDAMDAENWPKLSLTIAPENSGTTTIAGEEGVTRKYVPTGDLTINATPAEGYHFVSWTSGTNEVSTDANYEFNITAATELTANFAINSYSVNVTAENGSATANVATVEHGGEVTLTATANDGWKFIGWYNGETLVSTENPYTFTVTSDVNYTAKYEEQAALPTYAVSIETVDAEGNTLTNNATGQVKAIINNVGQSWATAYDFVEGSDIEMVAVSDYNQQAYLFEGWYKNNVLVSNELKITVQATEAVTYQARFVKGCVVTAKSNKNQFGYATSITLVDGTSIGYDATNRAVVKSGTTVRINTTVNMIGYHVKNWVKIDNLDVQPVNGIFEGEEVGTEQNLVVEINEDAIFGVNFAPVIYVLTVSTEQSIMGSVNAMVGTSYSGTSVPVECGQTATIVATPAEGYKFVKWTKDDVTVSTSATYTVPAIDDVTAMNDVEYVAVFEEGAEEPVVDPFLTACYRLRWKSASNQYLNVNNHDTHEKGTYGGVGVAAKDENSNAQIFFFEASGDGYKLKDKNGYYIKGQEWNVDANTTNAENASVLLFEKTTTANEYYIKWYSTADKYKDQLKYFKVGYATNTAINFPYCDASKADAAVWVLEKVADIISYTVTDEDGNKYSGTYLGTAGVDKPTFTGVYEYELTNEAWNGVNYTADIVFPVPLENVMILPFEGSTGIRYYVDANNNVKATKTLPGANATAPALDDYLWKFEPLFNNGKFTFKIKSVVKDAYMTTAKTSAGHGEGYVKISTAATDTPMEFTIAEGNRLKIEGLTNLYLSTSSSSSNEQHAGIYGYIGSQGDHTGIINKFSCKEGTYRVVDNAGNVHEGEYDNYIVTFNGAYGYTLSDVSYNADVFEATINLPFTVSKEGETPNEILLAIYSNDRYLHAVGNNVKVQTTNVAQVDINCLWAIYPECENGNFKFAIKNVSNGKYIYSAANDEQNILQTEGTVMLSTIPSKFEYIHDGSYEGLKFADRTKLYLSINGQNDTDVLLGVHKAIHKGTDIFSPSFNSYGVTIGNAGYATFYAEKAVNIPTDVEAYYLVEEGINASERYVSLTKLENGVIPAGEAVVLKAEKGTYTFEFNATSTETIENNLFEGTVAATYIEDDAYVLSVLDGEIGLYLAWKNFDENYNKIGEVNGQKIDSKYFLNNGHKIYLPKSVVPSAAALSAGFRFMFGTTAIEDVDAEDVVDTIYDLSGRKLEGISGTGIYIINGKKVIVK